MSSPSASASQTATPRVAPGEPGARLARMSPANFGMVMATGIVSIAAHMLGHELIAKVLFVINNVMFLVLCVLSVLRAVRHPRLFFGDMFDHRRGPGFFTTVAACGVLGSEYMVLAGDFFPGRVLWAVSLVLWALLTYAIYAAFTIKRDKPTLDQGLSGAWLLAIVATQAIAVSSSLLSGTLSQPVRLEFNFLALSMWLWGGMLYIWTMALIFYRYTFFRFSPADLTPPYWINMGAMAISTLAGSLLIGHADQAAPYLESIRPFIKGFTVFYWAAGTWWIPMLLILSVWRYVWQRYPLRYDPLYWGAVFPLGMYAAATYEMQRVMELGFLLPVAQVFFVLACIAWSATFFGLARRLLRRPAEAI